MKTQFKIGDRVFSYSLQEWGVVTDTYFVELYPVLVDFPEYGSLSFTTDGRRSIKDKAPDLFFDEIIFELPQRPLQDKDIIKCWDNDVEFEQVYRFYDVKNNMAFSARGDRNGYRFDNMIYVPDEEASQELVAMRDKLED